MQWLVVRETDDDKTRARKKKLQKSHKSKLRFQQLDQEVKHRQDNWQNFKKGKGAKKKVWQLSLRQQQIWLCRAGDYLRHDACWQDSVRCCACPVPEARRPQQKPDCLVCVQTGFLSAGKKGSMFSVPEGVESKVGVIGSGQGMTAQPTGTKHEFSLGI